MLSTKITEWIAKLSKLRMLVSKWQFQLSQFEIVNAKMDRQSNNATSVYICLKTLISHLLLVGLRYQDTVP